jgi:hypothetical protein
MAWTSASLFLLPVMKFKTVGIVEDDILRRLLIELERVASGFLLLDLMVFAAAMSVS